MKRTRFNDAYMRYNGKWHAWIDGVLKKIGEAPYYLSLAWTDVMRTLPKRRWEIRRPLHTCIIKVSDGYILASADSNLVYVYLCMEEEKALCFDELGEAHEWIGWRDRTQWPWVTRYADASAMRDGALWMRIVRCMFTMSPVYAIKCARMLVSHAWLHVWDCPKYSRVVWADALQVRPQISYNHASPLMSFVRELDRFEKWYANRQRLSYAYLLDTNFIFNSLYPWRNFALAAGWSKHGEPTMSTDGRDITFHDQNQLQHEFNTCHAKFFIYQRKNGNEKLESTVNLTFLDLLNPIWRYDN